MRSGSVQTVVAVAATAIALAVFFVLGVTVSVIEEGQRDDSSRCEQAKRAGLSCDWGKSDLVGR